jgi:hypothetical protein
MAKVIHVVRKPGTLPKPQGIAKSVLQQVREKVLAAERAGKAKAALPRAKVTYKPKSPQGISKSVLKQVRERVLKAERVGKAVARLRGKIGTRASKRGGHRGMAFVNLKKRYQAGFTEKERSWWQPMTEEEAAAFLYHGAVVFVHSSNVVFASYNIALGQMTVGFGRSVRRRSVRGGKVVKGPGASVQSTYLYDNVTEDEAISFTKAGSKGGWVWDNLRVRGSKTLHKKPYRRVS